MNDGELDISSLLKRSATVSALACAAHTVNSVILSSRSSVCKNKNNQNALLTMPTIVLKGTRSFPARGPVARMLLEQDPLTSSGWSKLTVGWLRAHLPTIYPSYSWAWAGASPSMWVGPDLHHCQAQSQHQGWAHQGEWRRCRAASILSLKPGQWTTTLPFACLTRMVGKRQTTLWLAGEPLTDPHVLLN